MYRVAIYCPDRHILYRGATPDRQGVGGGVTVRIRLAQALVALGHEVLVVGHVPRAHSHRGVKYRPLDAVDRIDCDVLVLTSSGGALDLRPIHQVEVQARLREIWVHGTVTLQGLDEVSYDSMAVVSNFIRHWAQTEWKIPRHRVFVAYNGFVPHSRRVIDGLKPGRNPYRLIYANHPSKGLDAALGVLRILRQQDRRYELHVFGGESLWGAQDRPVAATDGVVHHGLVGQRRLAAELHRSGFALSLQTRAEPCSTLAMEAMGVGTILLASPVGSFPELIRPGFDGFLVAGDPSAPATQQAAAATIDYVVRHPDFGRYLRSNCQASPADWHTLARTWVGHWTWLLEGNATTSRGDETSTLMPPCRECRQPLLPLANGYHCTHCGCYTRHPPLGSPP